MMEKTKINCGLMDLNMSCFSLKQLKSKYANKLYENHKFQFRTLSKCSKWPVNSIQKYKRWTEKYKKKNNIKNGRHGHKVEEK